MNCWLHLVSEGSKTANSHSLPLPNSVPTFQGLSEEILSKLADVMEEVSFLSVLVELSEVTSI